MPWIKNGAEYTDAQIRATHPNTSFPSPIMAHNVSEFGYTWQDTVMHEPPVEQPRRVLRDWEFRDRFTQAEQLTILGQAFAGNVQAQYLLFKLQTASDGVNLDSPEVVAGVTGFFGAERAAEILA